MPHLDACVECGVEDGLIGYLPSAGGAVCRACGLSHSRGGTFALSPEGLAGIRSLLLSPLADARVTDRAARESLSVIMASYEHHGGFRLRTLSA